MFTNITNINRVYYRRSSWCLSETQFGWRQSSMCAVNRSDTENLWEDDRYFPKCDYRVEVFLKFKLSAKRLRMLSVYRPLSVRGEHCMHKQLETQLWRMQLLASVSSSGGSLIAWIQPLLLHVNFKGRRRTDSSISLQKLFFSLQHSRLEINSSATSSVALQGSGLQPTDSLT